MYVYKYVSQRMCRPSPAQLHLFAFFANARVRSSQQTEVANGQTWTSRVLRVPDPGLLPVRVRSRSGLRLVVNVSRGGIRVRDSFVPHRPHRASPECNGGLATSECRDFRYA